MKNKIVARFDYIPPYLKMDYNITFVMPNFKSFKNRHKYSWKLKLRRYLTKRRNK